MRDEDQSMAETAKLILGPKLAVMMMLSGRICRLLETSFRSQDADEAVGEEVEGCRQR